MAPEAATEGPEAVQAAAGSGQVASEGAARAVGVVAASEGVAHSVGAARKEAPAADFAGV